MSLKHHLLMLLVVCRPSWCMEQGMDDSKEHFDDGTYEGWTWTGSKEGGTRTKSDKYSGMFKDRVGRKALFKRDGADEQIAEYVVSRLFNDIADELGLETRLSVSYEWVVSRDGKKVALASIYENKDKGFKVINDRDIVDRLNPLEGYWAKRTLCGLHDKNVKNYEIMVALSLLFADYSIHLANIATVGNEQDRSFMRFDFGAAMRKELFTDEILPYKKICSRRRKYLNKNYFSKHHPDELTKSPRMADALNSLLGMNFDFEGKLREVWEQVKATFTAITGRTDYFIEFSARIGYSDDENTEDGMLRFLGTRLEKRKDSMKNWRQKILEALPTVLRRVL